MSEKPPLGYARPDVENRRDRTAPMAWIAMAVLLIPMVLLAVFFAMLYLFGGSRS